MKHAMRSWLLAGLLALGNPSYAGLADPLFVSKTGDVSLTYLGYEAAYTNTLWVYSPFFFGPLFENKTTPIGSTFSLGVLPAGTALTFGIVVHDTGFTYMSSAASTNPDSAAHALLEMAGPNLVNVGFEDLPNAGDRDYNDLRFSVANVTIAQVSEPPTALLVLSAFGLFALGLTRARRRTRLLLD